MSRMKTDNQHKELAFFYQQCRTHALKVTPKRVLIYEELIRSTDHPSPEMLFNRVQAKSPEISLDTVYRTVATFHEIGLVDIVEGFSLTKRFDPNQSNHHHARCTQCQLILDFENRQYDQLKIPAAIRKDFDIRRVRVTIEGLCKKCQSVQKGEK